MTKSHVLHSGLATREGKVFRLELQFKDDPLLELKLKDSSVISTPLHGYSNNEVKVYLRFTRMVNISSAGINSMISFSLFRVIIYLIV